MIPSVSSSLATSTTGLLKLPNEVLHLIFLFGLSSKDLIAASLTCKRLQTAAKYEHLWMRVFRQDFPRCHISLDASKSWKNHYRIIASAQHGNRRLCHIRVIVNACYKNSDQFLNMNALSAFSSSGIKKLRTAWRFLAECRRSSLEVKTLSAKCQKIFEECRVLSTQIPLNESEYKKWMEVFRKIVADSDKIATCFDGILQGRNVRFPCAIL